MISGAEITPVVCGERIAKTATARSTPGGHPPGCASTAESIGSAGGCGLTTGRPFAFARGLGSVSPLPGRAPSTAAMPAAGPRHEKPRRSTADSSHRALRSKREPSGRRGGLGGSPLLAGDSRSQSCFSRAKSSSQPRATRSSIDASKNKPTIRR